MSFGWPDYLRLAKKLAEQDDEASHRSAISRAYYAAFHLARRYVHNQSPGELRKTGEDHYRVWNYLSRGARRQEQAAGVSGKKLCDARKMADYDLQGLSFPRAVRDALSSAETIVNSLSALENEN